MIKVGSLFDGIGGWLLAATHAGAIPTWSSEIDPFPANVSHAHFPNAKQLGDITQVKGDEIEPVDIICAGSPCQDLSIAGQRAGLNGKRSNLFYQALRIVREMQVKTNGAYPKFFIWENVTGAFSSNGRRDFQAVLEEIAETHIPIPGSGRWARAGMVRSKQCGISWRVLDAQFWGVPQHRERIFLIAGFGKWGGLTEVLFEPESVRRDNTASEESGEATPTGTGRSADAASWGFGNGQVNGEYLEEKVGALNTMHDPKMIVTPTIVEVRQPKVKGQGGAGAMITENKCTTLSTSNTKTLICDDTILNDQWGGAMRAREKVVPTLTARMVRQPPVVFPQRAYDEYEGSEVGSTLKAYGGNVGGGSENIACVYESNRKDARYTEMDISPTLTSAMGTGGGNVPLKLATAYALKVSQTGANGRPYKEESSFSLTGQDHHAVQRIARKLTPKECERLQGLPDGYTDYGSDSKRYKALGNGMAQPCADYVMAQVVKAIREEESK